MNSTLSTTLAWIAIATAAIPAQDEPIEISARVRAAREISLSPLVQGAVVERPVERNSRVRKGQTILVIDPEPFELALMKAKAALDLAEARLDLAGSELGRMEVLAERGSADAAALDQARAMHRARAAEREMARVASKEAEWQLSQTRLAAPVDGLLAEVHPEVGTVVSPGAVVAEILTVDDLVAEAFLSAEEMAKVGDRERLVFRWAGGSMEVPVRERAPGAGRRQTYRLVVELPPGGHGIMAGVAGYILISGS